MSFIVEGKSCFFILMAITLLASSSVFALGIGIEPGANLVTVRQLGKPIETDPLRVINVNPKPQIYTIDIVIEDPLKGYTKLPDSSWIYPEKDSFRLEAYDTLELPIFCNIPDDEGYYNRAFRAEINVTQHTPHDEAARSRGFTEFLLAARSIWFFETPSKSNLPKAIDGDPISIAPTLYIIEYDTTWKDKTLEATVPVTIRNDDTITHQYFLETFVPDYGEFYEDFTLDILPFGEGNWIPDLGWLQPKKKGFLFIKWTPKPKLAPGESKTIDFKIELPQATELGDLLYDAVVMVKPEEQKKDSRFIRFVFIPRLKYE